MARTYKKRKGMLFREARDKNIQIYISLYWLYLLCSNMFKILKSGSRVGTLIQLKDANNLAFTTKLSPFGKANGNRFHSNNFRFNFNNSSKTSTLFFWSAVGFGTASTLYLSVAYAVCIY